VNVLRGLRSLVLGETWALPLAVAGVAGVALVLDKAAPDLWDKIGAPLLVVAVLGVLVFVVQWSVRSR
jgi:drug/metabolite transporter superfamily protein YnfA